MIDANCVISREFPSTPLSVSAKEHPLLHSRITELQVHTLLSADFSDHEIWTRKEIHSHLSKIARRLNLTSVDIFPNRLSDHEYFNHYKGNPTLPKNKDGGEKDGNA
jgi:hypothetical protein